MVVKSLKYPGWMQLKQVMQFSWRQNYEWAGTDPVCGYKAAVIQI